MSWVTETHSQDVSAGPRPRLDENLRSAKIPSTLRRSPIVAGGEPVKPAPFDYVAPTTLEEALTILVERGDEAKVLAGGQSLVPLLNMRLARPALLVDLNRLPGLDYVRIDDGGIAIGALTRQRALERSEVARSRAPLIVAATGFIGHPAIRNRGTVGGSLAHGDPVSELPCAATALDATLIATSQTG